jgi:hypothetical protein
MTPKRKFAAPVRIHKPMWLRQVGVQKSGWGVKTIKEVLGCLSMAALAIVLAAPVSAQTLALRASMPFDFVVGGRIVPTSAVTNAVYGQRDGAAFLTFHRYGGDYFLAAIWDGAGSGGRSIPISSTEKEKSQSASMAKPDVATVLARR